MLTDTCYDEWRMFDQTIIVDRMCGVWMGGGGRSIYGMWERKGVDMGSR